MKNRIVNFHPFEVRSVYHFKKMKWNSNLVSNQNSQQTNWLHFSITDIGVASKTAEWEYASKVKSQSPAKAYSLFSQFNGFEECDIKT